MTEGSGTTDEGWTGESARRWSSVVDRLEAQLIPVSEVLFDAARLRPGEVVLDVGCGWGSTTRRAAEEVGPTGAVTGLDIATTMIDGARSLPHTGAPIDWQLGDAQTAPLPSDRYDAVISRFGVMFFADPVAAFANLANATKPGGRACLAVWQRRDRSEIMQRPLDILVAAAARAGFTIELDPPDEGAFSFADEATVTGLLTAAGWTDVELRPHVAELYAFGPGSLTEVVDTALAMGQVRAALAGAPDDAVAAVRTALLDELADAHDGTGVRLSAAIAVVAATRP